MPNGGRLVTHEDITERQQLHAQLEQQHRLLKEHEEKLRVQNLQLDAALNNMVQGLAMFDADYRIVVANDRYVADVWADTGAGETWHDIAPDPAVPYRLGHYPGRDADEVLRETLARIAENDLEQLSERAHGRPLHRRIGSAHGQRRDRHDASRYHRPTPRRG